MHSSRHPKISGILVHCLIAVSLRTYSVPCLGGSRADSIHWRACIRRYVDALAHEMSLELVGVLGWLAPVTSQRHMHRCSDDEVSLACRSVRR
ncbi:hypothetical protein CC85DRAFT_110259 [Cutaneotrichosporon oleaginosum]|uniref:Secreted protein n=1 Tax=Cutaneotrichosporon oleaginosum TaxID=879819 RepID=A0A0J0XWZ5_9TREE|nr:uncharacterized protein CC85DRAFT_110259 [Cutaneotrichosporon oleaginosum]KLT45576.1 hypothetical protein CC85DRAFT_110259 [Cutaneotrichosporon oleaginosum]TXT04627.1 hypothetical protein COLE_07446 [Cutaneotrichosporon oleaginosum]